MAKCLGVVMCNRLWSWIVWVAYHLMLSIAFSAAFCAAERTNIRIPFRTVLGVLIVVQVRLNGSGPYAFLLDTGASSSGVDFQLSEALKLHPSTSALLSTITNVRDVRRAQIDDLELGPFDAGTVRVLIQELSGIQALDPRIRGVLGQDVLRGLDYLIDNRRHEIDLDPNGTLARDLSGERIPMTTVSTDRNEPTRDVSVKVSVGENGPAARMLLDSGATCVVFTPGAVQPLGELRIGTRIRNPEGTSEAVQLVHLTLRIGERHLAVAAGIAPKRIEQVAVDGLLPTACFDRVYVGNSEGFVILEPVRRPASELRNWFFGHQIVGR